MFRYFRPYTITYHHWLQLPNFRPQDVVYLSTVFAYWQLHHLITGPSCLLITNGSSSSFEEWFRLCRDVCRSCEAKKSSPPNRWGGPTGTTTKSLKSTWIHSEIESLFWGAIICEYFSLLIDWLLFSFAGGIWNSPQGWCFTRARPF